MTGLLRHRARAFVLGERDVVGKLQSAPGPDGDARPACRPLPGREYPSAAAARRLPIAPHVNAQRVTRGVEARDRKPKTVLEIQPADLAIGHYVEPNTFLQSDEFADARKLDCAKGIRSKRSIIETLRVPLASAAAATGCPPRRS